MERCAQCGANLAMVGRVHRCVPKSSRGGVEANTLISGTRAEPGYVGDVAQLDRAIPSDGMGREFESLRPHQLGALKRGVHPTPIVHIAGVAPGPRETKRGRPRIGEVRDKPWIAAGMSRATWYRRKAEAKPK